MAFLGLGLNRFLELLVGFGFGLAFWAIFA
jgi:hypothetical protein